MKIAIIGTAPQFVDAPFFDDEWQIWAVSGCFSVDNQKRNERIRRVYELHPVDTIKITCERKESFVDFANNLGEGFILREKIERYPNARVFDYKPYVERYGRSPFSCSVSWMIAEAIAEIEKAGGGEIGIWGVNMCAGSEYVYQKPGVRHMIGYADALGIKVFVPESSELMSLHSLYGVEELPKMLTWIGSRTKELTEKRNEHLRKDDIALQTANYFKGRRDEFDYLQSTKDDVSKRRELIELDVKTAEEEHIKETRNIHVFEGAIEEHLWIEQNFFKSNA